MLYDCFITVVYAALATGHDEVLGRNYDKTEIVRLLVESFNKRVL